MGKQDRTPLRVRQPRLEKRHRSRKKLERFNPRRSLWIPFPYWLFRHQGLSWTAKALYGRLCLYANERGEAWPSQATLAREMGLSEQSVRKHLRDLEDAELIASRRRSLGQSAVYTFLKNECMEVTDWDRHDDKDIPPPWLDPMDEPDDPLGICDDE